MTLYRKRKWALIDEFRIRKIRKKRKLFYQERLGSKVNENVLNFVAQKLKGNASL